MDTSVKNNQPTSAPALGEIASVDLVVVDQIRLLYAQLPVSQYLALVNAFILTGVQWPMINSIVLISWLAVFCIVTSARIGLGIAFNRAAPNSPEIHRWRDYFLTGSTVSGLLWGSAAILLFPPESNAHQMFTAFVLGGTVAGAITTLTPVYSAFLLFAAAIMAPLITRFLNTGDTIHYAMGGMSFIFLIGMVYVGRRISGTIADSLNLRFENHFLIKELTLANRRAEAFSEKLQIANRDLQKSYDELEFRVEQRTAQLSKANTELDTFASIASHDLQEPLRTIAGYVDLLETRHRDKFDQEATEFFGFIVSAVNRMRQLIDDVLVFSRAGANLQARGTVDCDQLLQSVLTSLKATMEERKAVVTHDPLPVIIADGSKLEQVFSNLLSNAFKFCGTAAPHVHIGSTQDESNWIFSVRDNGIGIEPEYHKNIFNLFERLHGSSKYPGTGIGLAVCKKAIEAHGGTIWVDSQPGAGATFFFTIPRTGTTNHGR
jgi:signal transduction histidine kinase